MLPTVDSVGSGVTLSSWRYNIGVSTGITLKLSVENVVIATGVSTFSGLTNNGANIQLFDDGDSDTKIRSSIS